MKGYVKQRVVSAAKKGGHVREKNEEAGVKQNV